jgi:hypothetical protein
VVLLALLSLWADVAWWLDGVGFLFIAFINVSTTEHLLYWFTWLSLVAIGLWIEISFKDVTVIM